MKKCDKCGAEIEDCSSFCSVCGSAVGAPCTPPAPNPVISMVKRSGSSTPFLVALISCGGETLFAGLSVILTALVSNAVISYIDFDRIFDLNGANAALSSSVPGSIASVLISSVLPILIFVGMLRFYLACRKDQPVINCSGLTMIRVCYTIYYVFEIVMFGLLLLGLLMLLGLSFTSEVQDFLSELIYSLQHAYNLDTFGISGGGLASILSIVFIFAMIFLAVYVVLFIIYGAKVLKSIKSVRNAVQTGAYPEPLSGFVIVMNYILAVFIAAGASLMLCTLNILGALSLACSCVALVCISIVMHRYNAQVKAFVVK